MKRVSLLFVLLLCLNFLQESVLPVWAQRSPLAKLISVQGVTTVLAVAGGPTVIPVVRGLVLQAGNVVRTAVNSFVSLLFADGRHVKLDENTTVEISRTARARMIVRGGRVWGRFPPGPAFIEGPAAVAFVRGTELVMEVAEDGTTTLTVAEGEVRFANERGSVVVRDGQQSRARPGEAPTPPIAANLPILLEWTNAVLPPLVLLEAAFVSQDPNALVRAAAEAERIETPSERRLRQGDVLHDQGRLVEALAAYDRAAEGAPAGDAGWAARLAARRGQTLLELGRLDEAEAEFRRAVAPAPGDAAARTGLAMTLLARGHVDAARAEAVAATLPGTPGTAPAHLALAVVEIRRGDLKAAGAALERALAADPNHAQSHAWKSYLLRASNDLAGAEEEAKQAVALAPNSATSRQALADVYLLEGRRAEARREARRAVALSPLSAGAHVSLANAELLAGNVEAAVREAHQGEALDPRSDRAQYTLGAALAERRRYAAAERHLRRAVELNPDLLDARSLLARVLAQQGRRQPAVDVAQEALARNPDLPSARAALGQVYRLQGRLREAAREYEAALALSPRNGIYHVEVARVYLDLNDLPAALSHAQEGVFLLPGSSEAHAILGLAYDRQDNRVQAEREYRDAISLSPDNSLARLGLVTGFIPGVFGSEQLGLQERAQALLRDPAVLQQVFEPGVTSELSGFAGEDSREGQRYLHRGQFSRGRVHDLSQALRLSDDGYRTNGSSAGRLIEADVAVQATGDTQVLAQYSEDKFNAGLPGPAPRPDPNDYSSRKRTDYNLHARHYLGRRTHLWLKHGIRAVRNSRKDPDAPPPPPESGQPPFGLFKFLSSNNERISELRLDHQVGRHRFSYGLADIRDNVRGFDLKLIVPGSQGTGGDTPPLALEIIGTVFIRDFVQYFQDDFRIGERGALVAGARLLRTRERTLQDLRAFVPVPPEVPVGRAELSNETEHDLFPYLTLTYNLDARNLVQILANETRLRPGNPLVAPSEAFIVGEPVAVFHNGRLETYELDYAHRLSPRTFSKLFFQHSLARNFFIGPTLDQTLFPREFTIPNARARVAGLRFEHQITRHLSGFTSWSYYDIEDRSKEAYLVAPMAPPAPNPSRGLQVPLNARWRGLTGLNYVDRTGTKASLRARFISRRFTDVDAGPNTFGTSTFNPAQERPSTGSRVLFDVRLGKEPSVRTEYSLSVTNLFNTSVLDWPGFPRRGRTWLLTIARRY